MYRVSVKKPNSLQKVLYTYMSNGGKKKNKKSIVNIVIGGRPLKKVFSSLSWIWINFFLIHISEGC